LTLSILLPAGALAWLGFRIFDLQRAYFQLKARAAAAGLAVEGLEHGDTMFAYYVAAALVLLLAGLFTRYLLWRDLRRYKQLAATVSHELRTPLTTIQLYAETLALGRVPEDAKQKAYLGTIARESRRLEHLLGNILRYVRIDWGPAGGGTRQVVDLREMAAAVAERLAPAFEPSGHRVQMAGPAGVAVLVDRGALEHAVENLLVNAAKYSAAGTLITLETREAAGECWLRVSDEGPGVPVGERERIFEEFCRLPGTTADGVGVGLRLGRRTVRSQGGDVTVEASAPRGAVFVIRLPRGRS